MMKKFAIIFLVFALAITVESKRHRFFNFPVPSGPSSSPFSFPSGPVDPSGPAGSGPGANPFSFPSAPTDGSNPGFNPFDLFQPEPQPQPQQQEIPTPLDVLQSLMTDDSAKLQNQLDFFGEGISLLLTSNSSQEAIRNITVRARNIAALLDVAVVRESVNNVIDDTFESLEAIRGEIINGLIAVNSSNSSVDGLKNFLISIEPVLMTHIESLNLTITSAIENITVAHQLELSLADQETINDVQSLLSSAVVESQTATTGQVNKLIIVSKILSLQLSILNVAQRIRLEREVRNQANQLVRDLRGLNITKLHGLASQVTNYVLDQIEDLQNNTITLANRALESTTPGNVLNDAFLEFKAGLGKSIIDLKRRTERAIIKFIRDTLQSLNIRNISGVGIQNVLESARTRVSARVNEIQSIIRRVFPK